MITVCSELCNSFSQRIYDTIISRVNIFSLVCTCGCKGTLVYHGSYMRHLKDGSECFSLKIQRVQCRQCQRTHALMPYFLVPYSQVSLHEQKKVLAAIYAGTSLPALLRDSASLDESYVRYLLRKFRKHWEQRLYALHLSLTDRLTVPCLSFYSRQFMQIRNTPNILFSPST